MLLHQQQLQFLPGLVCIISLCKTRQAGGNLITLTLKKVRAVYIYMCYPSSYIPALARRRVRGSEPPTVHYFYPYTEFRNNRHTTTRRREAPRFVIWRSGAPALLKLTLQCHYLVSSFSSPSSSSSSSFSTTGS